MSSEQDSEASEHGGPYRSRGQKIIKRKDHGLQGLDRMLWAQQHMLLEYSFIHC